MFQQCKKVYISLCSESSASQVSTYLRPILSDFTSSTTFQSNQETLNRSPDVWIFQNSRLQANNTEKKIYNINDTFMRVIRILVNWHISTGIFTMISQAFLIKISQSTRIAMHTKKRVILLILFCSPSNSQRGKSCCQRKYFNVGFCEEIFPEIATRTCALHVQICAAGSSHYCRQGDSKLFSICRECVIVVTIFLMIVIQNNVRIYCSQSK